MEKFQVKSHRTTAFPLIVSVFLLVLTNAIVTPAQADVPSQPTLISFAVTPDTIDIATAKTTVTLDLVVSNPTGIATTQTLATITNGSNVTLTVPLTRVDNPINASLQQVTFHGSLLIPSNVPTGVYSTSVPPITGRNADGTNGYSTLGLTAMTTSKVIGAKDSLLVRMN